MATLTLYLDIRTKGKDGRSPLKMAIRHMNSSAMSGIGVTLLPKEWDCDSAKNRIIDRADRRQLNEYIEKRLRDAETELHSLMAERNIRRMSARQLLDAVMNPETKEPEETGIFIARFTAFADSKDKPGTRSIYYQTIRRMKAFDKGIESRTFEDIDKSWLTRFESFMAKTASKNSRNIHLRNIRTVFNDAIDDNVTDCYPFRKFKIRPVATAKRSLSVEQMRKLMSYPVQPYQEQYRDIFMLSFYLCGINMVDLCNLRHEDIRNGRIEYNRAKTSKLYSIKLEPEAMDIIKKYSGDKHLLNILDRYKSHLDYLKHVNKALSSIGTMERKGLGGKKIIEPAFPGLTTYWARHTWATMAAELDIPKETIAAALGHGSNSVTDIYIRFNEKKIDRANRKVIDYLLGKCKPEECDEE